MVYIKHSQRLVSIRDSCKVNKHNPGSRMEPYSDTHLPLQPQPPLLNFLLTENALDTSELLPLKAYPQYCLFPLLPATGTAGLPKSFLFVIMELYYNVSWYPASEHVQGTCVVPLLSDE